MPWPAPCRPPFCPPRSARWEAASRDVVQIRDRTHLTMLAVADRASAHFLYYPGRIFKDARGTLPVIYRGAGESLLVDVYEDRLYLFDAEPGGNGAARAIYRDGIEPLLRLVQVMVERVTSLERLRALFDEWGDEDEIIAESRGEVGKENDEVARQNLMGWLDSRLFSL